MSESTAPEPTDYVVKSYQLFYVVSAKDETIGHVKTYSRHGVTWLTDVWVDPEHRRRTMARQIMERALAAHVGEEIYLTVHGYTNQPLSDDQLIEWYGKFGFVSTGVPGVLRRPAAAQEPQ